MTSYRIEWASQDEHDQFDSLKANGRSYYEFLRAFEVDHDDAFALAKDIHGLKSPRLRANEKAVDLYVEGYQDAVKDFAASLREGGIEKLLKWGAANTKDKEAREQFERELHDARVATDKASEKAKPHVNTKEENIAFRKAWDDRVERGLRTEVEGS